MMKKIFNVLFIMGLIVALFLTAGCSETKSPFLPREPISFEDAELKSEDSANYMPLNDFSEFKSRYDLEHFIVFIGEKDALSIPVDAYENFKNVYYPDHCETPLRVSKVFYGDVQVGDRIFCREWIKVFKEETGVTIYTQEGVAPIAEGEEYLFILSDTDQKSTSGTDLYGTTSSHFTYHKVSDYDVYKEKVQNGTASSRERFGYEALNYYLNQPETKLELRKEALKYVESIPEDATEEEILDALPQEQKELFKSMITQYGTTAEKE